MLFVPEISLNLVSVGQLLESGLTLNFHDKMCEVFDRKGVKLMEVEMYGYSFPLKWKDETAFHVTWMKLCSGIRGMGIAILRLLS